MSKPQNPENTTHGEYMLSHYIHSLVPKAHGVVWRAQGRLPRSGSAPRLGALSSGNMLLNRQLANAQASAPDRDITCLLLDSPLSAGRYHMAAPPSAVRTSLEGHLKQKGS